MENENWFSRPGKVRENKKTGESHGKVMKFEISLKLDFCHICMYFNVVRGGGQLYSKEVLICG